MLDNYQGEAAPTSRESSLDQQYRQAIRLAKLEELERQVENLPTDRARESKIIEEFSKLAKVVESSVRYDKRKPPLP